MSLRKFLKKMESEGEVLHVKDKVSPRFEVSAIMKALADGPILYFDDVQGYETRSLASVRPNIRIVTPPMSSS